MPWVGESGRFGRSRPSSQPDMCGLFCPEERARAETSDPADHVALGPPSDEALEVPERDGGIRAIGEMHDARLEVDATGEAARADGSDEPALTPG